MKIVAILYRSAGNESVGEMWRQTKIFESDITPLNEVMQWAMKMTNASIPENFNTHLELTIAKEQE